jgi:hypothetical protein
MAEPPEQLQKNKVATPSTDAQHAVSAAQRRKLAVPDHCMLSRRRFAAVLHASPSSSKESVFDSPDMLQLILSKCGIRGVFAASAVCHPWQAGAQNMLLFWQDERRWSSAACEGSPAETTALCEEALAVLQIDSGVHADQPGAVRCSDRVLVACVELLRAARHSRAAVSVRSKIDRCFLKWLTLLD